MSFTDNETRRQIDAIQFHSLTKLAAVERPPTFLGRVALYFQTNFFGQPWRKKIDCLIGAAQWVTQKTFSQAFKLRQRLREPPRSREHGRILRVAVHGTGSLGDFLSHVLLIQEFCRNYGPVEVDFYAHQIKVDEAKFVFAQTPLVRQVVSALYLKVQRANYDLIIHSRYIVKYEIMNHQRMVDLAPKLLELIATTDARFLPYKFIFDRHPLLDGALSRLVHFDKMSLPEVIGYFSGLDIGRASLPNFCADIRSYDVLKRYGLDGRRYITVHDGFDQGNIVINETATKCWPLDRWRQFVSLMKQDSDITIVQIGAKHSRPIEGVDVDLVSKTTLDEVAWVLKHSLLHIDGESGLVRMAHALHTRSIVLFGPTSESFFALAHNTNIVADGCNNCWWSTADWLSLCPRGFERPPCMQSIAPQRVRDAAVHYLGQRTVPKFALQTKAIYPAPAVARGDRLAEFFTVTGLPAVPISQDARNTATGVYLQGSQQWACAQALDAVADMTGRLRHPLRIAVIGGGRSALAPFLAIKGHQVEIFDLDYRKQFAANIEEEWRFRRWAADHGLKVRFGSPYNLAAATEDYDLAICLSGIGRTQYQDYAVEEALRLLRPGGQLFLSFALAGDGAGADERIETVTPALLREALRAAEVGGELFSADAIKQSAQCIQADRVAAMPAGVTLGCCTIVRRS